jgi:threonyl-tRNA synthetase
MQYDPMMPERLDASFIDEHSQRQRPIMLHRAIVGSMERFIGILIEHHAGAMPLWLAPVQAVIAPIVSDADAYAKNVAQQMTRAGLRVDTDLRNEKINYKIREHASQKIPVIVIVGRKEAEEGTVTLRLRGEEKQETLPVADAIRRLSATV